MAYEHDENYENRENYFEEDPAYGTEAYFGETIDSIRDDDLDQPEMLDPDQMSEDDVATTTSRDPSFGESLSQESDMETLSPADTDEDEAMLDNDAFSEEMDPDE